MVEKFDEIINALCSLICLIGIFSILLYSAHMFNQGIMSGSDLSIISMVTLCTFYISRKIDMKGGIR